MSAVKSRLFRWSHMRRDFLDLARDFPGHEEWGLSWVEAIGEIFHLNKLRPLSSALLRLDFALFGDAPFGYHVHALAWLALFVGICGLLLSRLPRRVAALARRPTL